MDSPFYFLTSGEENKILYQQKKEKELAFKLRSNILMRIGDYGYACDKHSIETKEVLYDLVEDLVHKILDHFYTKQRYS